MIKKKNKIRVLLTEDGSIGKLELPVKLHTGSVNMTDIEVLVPITVNRTSSSFVKIYGNTVNEKGEKVWSSDTYSVNFKTIDVVDKFEYASYEDKLPDEFSAVSGDLNITLAYADLAEDGTAIDILPSQTIHLYVNGAGFNQNGVQISNYDSTVARVNLLSELSVLKIDVSKELPLGIVFNKDGYKSSFYNFYTVEYTLPINATETATKECKVIANSIVKDIESPEVIGYQTEYAYFDGGICQRTNKYNISQGSVNNYVLLENGAWEIVNQDYITPIKAQVDQNAEDIEVLYRLANTGSTPLGEYPSQDTVPTDSELNQYVQENFGRAPQNGDEFTFVLLVEDGTDVVYILLYSEVIGKWGKTALPSVEPAKNGSLGIIKGTAGEEVTATRKVLVDINNGEIGDILHNNESGEQESLSAQVNRNSQNVATNTADIAEIEQNLSAEITRATGAEETLTTNLSAEIERAKSAEQANTTAIENEVSRATTKEGELDNDKLDKTNVNDDYLKDIVFSINGDNGVATLQLHNPVTGQTQNVEITVTTPASSTNTGLMTSEMVQALTKALEDIESLKYIGKQVASFQSYAEAELFDFATLTDVNVNDYFIVQVDESRTEPTEKDQTTKYICINDATPITLESFQFQSVVTTVNIQVATESNIGGVLSVNTNGYIYVESNGAMKLVGYDNLITSINNLTTAISNETTRAEEAEETLSQAITAETTRAQQAESALQTSKADKTELPTKVSELENDENYATVGQIPTDNSQLANGANYATVGQIPTDNSQLANGAGYAKIKVDTASNWEINNPVLSAGEFGYDSTNKITKIGDGSTAWNDLVYFVTKEPLNVGTFADTSWKTIAEVSATGEAQNYFNVGDEKTIELTTGEEVTLVILGFNHDDLTSGGKAGISIGMKNQLATTYPMNPSNTNTGGWNNSAMRTSTMATLLSQLPSDLQSVIKSVNKKATDGGGSSSSPVTTITTSTDKLWLFALAEVYSKVSIEGSTEDIADNAAGYEAEGEQYDYYYNLIGDNNGGTSANAALVKRLSNGIGIQLGWWLRSPLISFNGNFRAITNRGMAAANPASGSYGVSFGFCV